MLVNREMKKKIEKLSLAISNIERIQLAALPTPLIELKKLSKKLLGPRIFIKRDDLTGLSMGGNKVRMLEYTIAKALKEGADSVIGTASVQSNYCCQLSAAANKADLEVYLVLKKIRGDRDLMIQGNYLLDYLLGANIKLIEPMEWDKHVEYVYKWKNELISKGKNPYIMRAVNKKDNWLDSLGYVMCFMELVEQFRTLNIAPRYIFTTASDTTLAGLLFAQKYIGFPVEIIAIKPSPNGSKSKKLVYNIIKKISEKLDLKVEVEIEDINLITDFIGEGYGIPSKKGIKAIKTLAQTEGIFLDPVYSGKGFSGLIDYIRKDKLDAVESVVFLHTGGLPALFAYKDDLLK